MEQQRRRKDWRETESLEDAARRLLAKMDERANAKKQAGGKLGPALIAYPALKLEKEGPGQSDRGVRTLNGPVPIAAAGEVGSGLDAGEVKCVGPVEPNEVTMRSPAPDADSNRYMFTTGLEGSQSRAVRRGKG
ncbi:hypothetical protein CIT25_04070 [Mesorhizobium mediterraneum]|uniref:Uncharacterized protein n=1 Tax=Mesorhizobium mediterraneum TaxID=43617 RepID=A0AB36RHE6_9HYPH|nr:hypothetical protein CIT25_04070 [Mesorhizobium mediterraneum]